jgi:hypothetical protein
MSAQTRDKCGGGRWRLGWLEGWDLTQEGATEAWAVLWGSSVSFPRTGDSIFKWHA